VKRSTLVRQASLNFSMPNCGDLGVTADAELLLGDHLGGQAVAVPAEAAVHLLAAHRAIAGHRVLHEPGEQVAVVRQAVRERRAVVEDVLVGAVTPRGDRRLERVPSPSQNDRISRSSAGKLGCGSTLG
jgi:hypothetical protein